MNRLFGFISNARLAKDWHGLLLLLVIFAIAGWLIAMPFSEAIQMSTINRFHLTTRSFPAWALQQPIPPMYNLENRYWHSPRRLASDELAAFPSSDVETKVINHFPARMITFSRGRQRIPDNQSECWFYLHSKYRQSQRVTCYKLTPVPDSNAIRAELFSETP